MKTVLEYLGYRKYILDYYLQRKNTSGFSWREFAKLAGFTNPVYLKQVCDGKYNLSKEAAVRVAKAMNLVGVEYDYFVLLTDMALAKTEMARQKVLENIRRVVQENGSFVLDEVAMKYFENWKHAVVREVAAAMPGATESEIAAACIPKISTSEVSTSLQLLLKLGLLKHDKDGNYRQTKKVLSNVHKKANPMVAVGMQQEMGQFAVNAMKYLPVSERFISGVTMGISEKMYERVCAELVDFRSRLVSIIATEDKDVERVYQLNFQLFPMTNLLKKKQ